MDVHDYTAQSAQREFYPDLAPEDIAKYAIAVTTSADWHSEVDTWFLWLPRDEQARNKILAEEFPAPSYNIIEVEEDYR